MAVSLTNEEWARKAKEGERGAVLALWNGVVRFIEWQARKYADHPGCRTTAEDLTQAGFFALLDAIELYRPEQGTRFLTVLSWTLKKHFADENGMRTSKRDALQYSGSTDEPREIDGDEVTTEIEDEGAALAFMGVEYADFLTYCRGVINAAFATLTERQAAILRAHYLEGRTLEETAAATGFSCGEAARNAKETALYRLEYGSHAAALRECLEAFEDFHTYHSAAHGNHWRDTGLSQTEAAALVR